MLQVGSEHFYYLRSSALICGKTPIQRLSYLYKSLIFILVNSESF